MDKRIELDGAHLFSSSAQRIVDYLNAHTAISDWSVSRVTGGEQIHLHVHHVDLFSVGDRVPWPDTFCSRMTLGSAKIVPDSLADPDYADLADAQKIRSYAGSPILDDDGSTFGILCGVGRDVLPGPDAVDEDLIVLFSDLLSSQLAMAHGADRERRAADIAEALAQTDSLTGLTNRRGWDELLSDAQRRVDAYGDPVAVAVLDLDGLKDVNDTHGHEAGDELLRRTAATLRETARSVDRTARYGGDEFVILSNNVPVSKLADHFGRFAEALTAHGVSASMGFAATGPGVVNLTEAFARADADMYEMKHARKASRATGNCLRADLSTTP